MAFSRPPVDPGDRLKVKIDAQGADGQGIAHLDDFVVFVPNAEVGKEITVIIEKCARTYANARRVE